MLLLECNNDSEFGLTEDFGRGKIPEYAILSHTWGADIEEVTYRDLIDSTGKNKVEYEKIRFCGEQARHDGLQYFWVNTCCIDKSNKNELAEAINSMFRWHRDAAKCYVFLSDAPRAGVDTTDHSHQLPWESAFRTSRWFTRGWCRREAIGYCQKAFAFLQLPREVRDQIYSYALETLTNVRPEPRPIYLLSLEPLSWKPPSPALCLVNKQIHREAVEILYSRNIFCFQNPSELLRFEEQIGPSNRSLIQRIDISTAAISENSLVPDPDLVPSCDWQGVPTHRSKALMRSSLENVNEMTLTVEDLGLSEQNSLVISSVLQQAIEHVLQRNRTGGNDDHDS